MAEKSKSGAGKFFLGAALGAVAATVTAKFIGGKKKSCKCGEDCKCDKKAEKTTKATTEKKEAGKKAKSSK